MPFREVETFVEKCHDHSRTFEIECNFLNFSKFSKFYETCRIYWNQLLKHACEILANSEKLKFDEKCHQRRPFRNKMNFSHFLKILEISWNFQNLLESVSETCMFNLRSFRKAKIVDENVIRETCRIFGDVSVAQLVASASGVVLGGVAEVVGSNLARGKIFKATIGSVDSLYILLSASETCMWNLRPPEKSKFVTKMPSASDLRNRMKFSHFPKNISVLSHSCLVYKELYRRVLVQNMTFYEWPQFGYCV